MAFEEWRWIDRILQTRNYTESFSLAGRNKYQKVHLEQHLERATSIEPRFVFGQSHLTLFARRIPYSRTVMSRQELDIEPVHYVHTQHTHTHTAPHLHTRTPINSTVCKVRVEYVRARTAMSACAVSMTTCGSYNLYLFPSRQTIMALSCKSIVRTLAVKAPLWKRRHLYRSVSSSRDVSCIPDIGANYRSCV